MNELVPVASAPLAVPGKSVALDADITLVAEYRTAKKALDYWKKEIERLKGMLTELIGDAETATLDDEPIFTYKPINSFNEGEFKKTDPELHKLYMREVRREELDIELLKRARPDVYARYQVRPLKGV